MLATVLLLVVAAAAFAGVPGTSGRLVGTITNSTDTAATAIYGPTTCRGSLRAASAFFAYGLTETGGTTAVDATVNGRTGAYVTPSGITYGVAGPCPRDTPSSAVTLNGSTGFLQSAASTQAFQTFTAQVWFRTTTTSGGKLLGMGDGTGTAPSTNYDRHVYMTNAGKLVFGVFPGSFRTVTSPASYNDGQWHHLVVTLSSALLPLDGLGMRLYVDGAQVAADGLTTSAQSFTGSWRFGFDNLSTWPTAPTSSYFAGSLAWPAVWTTALTSGQVTTLYQAGR